MRACDFERTTNNRNDQIAIMGNLASSFKWKSRFGRFWGLRHRFVMDGACARKCVLLYHSIGEGRDSLPLNVFENQMRYLAEHMRVVPLRALLEEKDSNAGVTCALTWDDGYESVHTHALPILRKYGFRATVYVTTGVIGERSNRASDEDGGLTPGLSMLTWPQIRTLQANGFTVGAHLVHHLDLTKMTGAQALSELQLARTSIEKKTGEECIDFAYPWGRSNRRCAAYVRAAGYRQAVTTVHGPVPTHFDPMFLPRMNISREYDMRDFSAILRGDWDYLAYYQGLKKICRPLTWMMLQ